MFQDGVKKNISSARGPGRDKTPRYSPSEDRLPSEAKRPATQPGAGYGGNADRDPEGSRRSETARHCFPSLPFQQFQALFNSLFKVLCIFPSRYLFAIGLPPVFSFRWNLPPALSCNPKQLDSWKTGRTRVGSGARTGLSPSLMLFSKRLRLGRRLATPLQTTIRARRPDLQRELFPLHSPLLGESWLVSFPPLSYMLKFSGSSCLIGGPNEIFLD